MACLDHPLLELPTQKVHHGGMAWFGDEVAQLDRPAFPRPSLWVERAGYESILVEAESLTGGILTVAESWYPHWRVYVDGTPRPLLRCNWSLLGVHLEPGRHHVSFRYQRPTYMYVGYAISLVTVLLMVLWWSWYIGRTLEVERLVVSQLSAEPPSRGTHGPIND